VRAEVSGRTSARKIRGRQPRRSLRAEFRARTWRGACRRQACCSIDRPDERPGRLRTGGRPQTGTSRFFSPRNIFMLFSARTLARGRAADRAGQRWIDAKCDAVRRPGIGNNTSFATISTGTLATRGLVAPASSGDLRDQAFHIFGKKKNPQIPGRRIDCRCCLPSPLARQGERAIARIVADSRNGCPRAFLQGGSASTECVQRK